MQSPLVPLLPTTQPFMAQNVESPLLIHITQPYHMQDLGPQLPVTQPYHMQSPAYDAAYEVYDWQALRQIGT